MMHAAIAIGSNSTRMLCAEKTENGLGNILRGREETRLFSALDENGCLPTEKIRETVQAVKALHEAALKHGAKSCVLFATSASRDAKNSRDLVEGIRRETGLAMQIISGEEEARLAFFACAGREKTLVMDIGGGSTELTLGMDGNILSAASAQMGASRLMRIQEIWCEQDAQKAVQLAKAAMQPFTDALKERAAGARFVGIGGTCTAAAGIANGRMFSVDEMEGAQVALSEAKRQLQMLAGMTLQEREQVDGLPATRALHMPNGLCILIAVMELLGFDRLSVSGRNNLDGYLLALEETV